MSFYSLFIKEYAFDIVFVEIVDVIVLLGDSENRLILVKIYEAFVELFDIVVIGRLFYYGRVLSFRRDRIVDLIENGVRTARMRLIYYIFSVLNLVGETVRVWYST